MKSFTLSRRAAMGCATTLHGALRAFFVAALLLFPPLAGSAGYGGSETRHAVRHTLAAADGATLDVCVMGDGPPLLVLTGYAMTSEMWDATFIRELAASRQVILMDNRGMGPSPLGEGREISLRRMALDAEAVLDLMAIDRADVLGWSMGGMITQELALMRPDRVRSLVLVASAADIGPLLPALDRMKAMGGEEIRQAMFPAEWAVRHVEAHKRIEPRPRPPDVRVIQGQEAAMRQWEGTTDRLADLRAPVLIVAGGRDWVCPPEAGRVMYERLEARTDAPVVMQIVAQGGHWMMHQFPEMLAGMVDGFLGRDHLGARADVR
ncbi:MAG: alpha/beta fold hydrolase [Thermodesulfobacteriota bacterium]